jgi:hypothetical protein
MDTETLFRFEDMSITLSQPPRPGFTPPSLGREDECMRLALACAIGIEPIKIPFVDPDQDYDPWIAGWRQVCLDLGWNLLHVWTGGTRGVQLLRRSEDEFWIAAVPSVMSRGRGAYHAVVMCGDRLHYDPNRVKPRKRRPTKFLGAYYLDPLDA